uniref:MFS transporter n=1 Tax=Cyberlindnera americana TaxID=36016 RepID=A0A5P8N8J0_9ASCO|nr:MFS transporter [Cyberlindnera americana]
MVSEVITEDLDMLKSKDKSVFEVAKENILVVFIVLFASLAGVLFGYDQGVISGILTMENFGSHFPRIYADSDFKGWFVSSLLLCAWFGSLVAGPIVDSYGRKPTMIVASFIFIIGSIFQCAGASISMLFGGRCTAGFAVGILTMCAPLYMAEIGHPVIRGSLVALQQLSITFGILISFWIDYGTNHIGGTKCNAQSQLDSFNPYTDVPIGGCTGQKSAAWRIPFGLQIIPAFILGVGMIFMPESPRYLVYKGEDHKALEVLSYIRRLESTNPDLEAEFAEIKGEVLFEAHYKERHFGGATGISLFFAEYKNLFGTRSNFKRVFLGSWLMWSQQFQGCNAIIYYAPTMFAMLGLNSNTTTLLATGVYGVVNFLSTIPAVLLMDKIGRKPLLIAGAIGTFSCLLIVGAILAKYQSTISDHKSAGYAAMVFIYIYDINFSYSYAPIGWIYPSEIFSIGIRSKAISITTSSTWMNNFIIGLVTPHMLETMKWGTYIFFAAVSLFSVFFVWVFLPETRKRTLEEMDEVFGDDKAFKDKQDYAHIKATLHLDTDSRQLERLNSTEKFENEHLESA